MKVIGKIKDVQFGYFGLEDAFLGLTFIFEYNNNEYTSCEGFWDSEKVKWNEKCKWLESDRDLVYSDTLRFISKKLKAAKVNNINGLIGKTVEFEIIKGNEWIAEWEIYNDSIK